MAKHNSQRGLTLIEVLIVIVIMELLSVLVYISLTDVTSVEKASRDKITNWIQTTREKIFIGSSSTYEAENSNSSSKTKPAFSSFYQVSTNTQKGEGAVNDIKIEITALDLAERKINGIKVDLSAQGLPAPNEAYAKINATKEKSVRDWTCQLDPIIICQGPTVLETNKKSTFDLFFTKSIGNAPANLTVDLLENNATVATLTVPLQNPL